MSFDPDAYLAGPAAAPASGFDPDAYLKEQTLTSKVGDATKLAARGATSEGLYYGLEGASRMASYSPVQRGVERVQDWLTEKIQGFPLTEEQKASRRKSRGEAAEKTGSAAFDRGLQWYADAVHETRDKIKKGLPVAPESEQALWGQVSQGVGQAIGTLPTYVIPGMGPATTVGQLYQQGYDDALEHGADEITAHDAGVKNVPGAALEYLSDKIMIGRVLKPLKGKLTVGELLKGLAITAASEGATEAGQQAWQNYVASSLSGFDPNRKLDDGVINAAVVGATVGGLVGGGGPLLSEGARRIEERMDTGENIPERAEDLQAQQRQLQAGDRAVQMFPLGTTELPLPAGMQRVETPRGIFHFDPRRMTADEILSASKKGRENELLGLGPYSKAEIQKRAAAGEPVAVVTERGPAGEELRGAVATPSTVQATKAALEQGKSEGSTVQVEPLQETLAKRDVADDIESSLPDGESKDYLRGRTKQDLQRQASTEVDLPALWKKTVDAVLATGASPKEFSALERNLELLADKEGRKKAGLRAKVTPERITAMLGNTVLDGALRGSEFTKLVTALAQSPANIEALRSEFQAARETPAAANQSPVPPVPPPGVVTPEPTPVPAALAKLLDEMDRLKQPMKVFNEAAMGAREARIRELRDQLDAEFPGWRPLAAKRATEAEANRARLREQIAAETEREKKNAEEIARKKAVAEQALKDAAEKRKAESARLAAIDRTGRDPESGLIADLRKVPSQELENFDWEKDRYLHDGNEVKPEDIEAILSKRYADEERAAAGENQAGYTLAGLLKGKPAELRAAGLASPLRLMSPKEARDRGSLGGEHAALRERTGGFAYFSRDGLVEDGLEEKLRELGFDVPDVTAAYNLIERAMNGEEVLPLRTEGNQVEFARRENPQEGTPAFKEWFRESKVVDETGKPLVVYHGSKATSENGFAFDFRKIEGRNEGAGFYFTDNEQVARGYGQNGIVIKAYLSLQKPMAYDHPPFSKGVLKRLVTRIAEMEATKQEADIEDGFLANYGDARSDGLAPTIAKAVESLAPEQTALDQISGIIGSGVSPEIVNRAVHEVTGYDGIVAHGFSNLGAGSHGVDQTIYVAFFPEQAKSVNNRGTFDPKNPQITYSRRQNATADTSLEGRAAAWFANLQELAPGLAKESELRFGSSDALVEQGLARRDELTGEEEAARVRDFKAKKEIFYLFEQALRRNTDDMTRLNLQHEMGHSFWDTLDRTTQQQLRELFAREIETKTGPLFDANGELRENVALGATEDIQEWFAERLAHANDRWAQRRIETAARGDTLVATIAAAFRRLLVQMRELMERHLKLDGYDDALLSDFRRFLDQGTAWNAEPAPAAAGRPAAAFAQRQAARPQETSQPQPERLKEFRDKWTARGVQNFVTERNGIITLSEVRVPEGQRGQGIGSEFMRELAAYADATNQEVALSPSTDFGASSITRLRKFYQRFGFVENKGRRKDYRISETMRRDPGQASFARRAKTEAEFDDALRNYDKLRREADAQLQKYGKSDRELLERLSEARMVLEESWPDWRKADQERNAEAEANDAVTPEPEPGMSADLDEREIAPEATAWKRSRLEASSFRPPGKISEWIGGLGKLFGNFRSAIPELPGGTAGREFTRFRQGYRMLKAATETVRQEAEDRIAHVLEPITALGREAIAPNEYRRIINVQAAIKTLTDDGKQVPAKLHRELAELEKKLDTLPYHLFRKTVLYRDLWFRTKILNNSGEPITLPMNLTREEVEGALRELHEKIAAAPERAAIEESLRRHYALVKSTRDDLLARGYVIPEELRNPLYFPHLMLEKFSGRLQNVKLDTAEDFRSYLQQLVGSAKDIETDYLTAMYYHMGQVMAHNARQDIVTDYWQPYDIRPALEEEVKTLNAQRAEQGLGPLHWRQLVGKDHVVYTVDDRIPLRPEYIINRQVLAERLGVELGEGDLQAQLRELGLNVTLTAADFQAAMAAGEKQVWVLPRPVAAALDGILERESDTRKLLSRVVGAPQALWKKWILYAPHNVVRYTYGNLVADLEKLFSADPAVFGQLLPAYREVREFLEGGQPSPDLKEAFKRGVIQSVTAAEVADLAKAQRFEVFLTSPAKLLNNIGRGVQWGRTVNELREASFRYAKFKADLERMRRGESPVYAGAYSRDVEAIEDSKPGAGDAIYAKAAEIARKTFVDYGDISVSGDGLRRYAMPFYSWLEGNFKYHANLFRNLADMSVGAGMSQVARGGLVAASKVVLPRTVTGVLLRLALPYVAVSLWNNSGDREELEKTLSAEDRRRFHIILGKDDQGRTLVTYAPTALSDVAGWFGGNDFARLAGEYWRGTITLPQAAHEWISNTPIDILNKAVQGISPHLKAVYIALSRRNPFPDVTDQRSISDHDLNWAILGSMTDAATADWVRRAVDKSYYSARDFGDWAQQLILQARKRDPEQWGYYATLDRVEEWQKAHGGTVDFGTNNKADAALLSSFRRAIRAADVPAAIEFYHKLLAAGYSAERFAASVRASDPLQTLKREHRQEFFDSLTAAEQQDVRNAYRYAQRMESFKNRERRLFPSEKASAGYKERFAAAPRDELFAGIMLDANGRTDEEEEMRAEKLLGQALRKR